jgi:uncharacterized membrane protein
VRAGNGGTAGNKMQQTFASIASDIALIIEAASVVIIAVGSALALYRTAMSLFEPKSTLWSKKLVWTHYAVWLLLGLEFELAADIIRSTIAPTWSDIGQLGAIAVIRTVLNYFLERDIDKASAAGET